jgi:hypothetical protein
MEIQFGKSIAIIACALLAGTCSSAGPSGDPASAAAASNRQCFNARTVNDFDAIDSDTVLVKVGARNIFKLDIVGVCPDIDWTNRIALRATGGSSWVCESMDAELLVPSPSGLQRCPVVGVQKLTAEQATALRAKPKN